MRVFLLVVMIAGGLFGFEYSQDDFRQMCHDMPYLKSQYNNNKDEIELIHSVALTKKLYGSVSVNVLSEVIDCVNNNCNEMFNDYTKEQTKSTILIDSIIQDRYIVSKIDCDDYNNYSVYKKVLSNLYYSIKLNISQEEFIKECQRVGVIDVSSYENMTKTKALKQLKLEAQIKLAEDLYGVLVENVTKDAKSITSSYTKNITTANQNIEVFNIYYDTIKKEAIAKAQIKCNDFKNYLMYVKTKEEIVGKN